MTSPHPLTGGARQVRSNPFGDPNSHLSLGEIDELRRLWRKVADGECNAQDHARLYYLNKRRVLPIYDIAPKGAA